MTRDKSPKCPNSIIRDANRLENLLCYKQNAKRAMRASQAAILSWKNLAEKYLAENMALCAERFDEAKKQARLAHPCSCCRGSGIDPEYMPKYFASTVKEHDQ